MRGIEAALNPHTLKEALLELLEEGLLGRLVAAHPNLPREALEALAQDPDPGVRFGVAENPSAPPEVLFQLVQDPDWRVRCAVWLYEAVLGPAPLIVLLKTASI